VNIVKEKNNRIREIIGRRDELRSRWREIRNERLKLRESLLEKGKVQAEVRKDTVYKKLKKEQEGVSKQIRHLEREINRIRVKNE
jgi:uncharacterized coiled-coil DUF342 family protein